MKKAQLIEYIQELEARHNHTERKLAEANYIIENSETLDKDVVRLAQTAFDEKRQTQERHDEVNAIIAEARAKLVEVEAKEAKNEALKAEIKALNAELQAFYSSVVNWYLRAKPEEAVHYLEKAFNLSSIDHPSNDHDSSNPNTI